MPDKSNKPIVKPAPIYYTIRLEAMAPVTIVYRVQADSEEHALELLEAGQAKQSAPTHVHYGRLRRLKATVTETASNLIKKVKNYV